MDTKLDRIVRGRKGIDTLPIQPAMNEDIIKHSRDCKPSRGEGEKGERNWQRKHRGQERNTNRGKITP